MDNLLNQIDRGVLWQYPGGIHPQTHKKLSNQTAINQAIIPALLTVPLKQHIGSHGTLIVNKGDVVLKGQPLTQAKGHWAVPVHAPTSGTIIDIAPNTSAHPSALPELSIMIEPDHQDSWAELEPCPDWATLEKDHLVEKIRLAGISGMGGAGFATYVKAQTQQNIEYLIINGVECEPYITADDRLMQEHAEQIIQGCLILAHVLTPSRIIIGIENDKPDAIAAMNAAAANYPEILVRAIPTKYPSGGEKQLIQVLTGREVPSTKLPSDIGIVVQNVATMFAIEQAVVCGKPLIERVVTVTGQTIKQPGNAWVLLGTQVRDVLMAHQFEPESDQRVIMGGPMMGFTLPTVRVPVIKTTNCLLAPNTIEMPFAGDEQACIRCSACADACPASLLPQQLQWFAKSKEHDKLEEHNLFDCIECGACAYVCPSDIPLVQYYRVAKAEIKEAKADKLKAERAKERFEARNSRLEREQAERQNRHKRQAPRAAEQDKDKTDAVAAALARAKAKQQTESTSNEEDFAAKRAQRKAEARAYKEQKQPANAVEAPSVDDKKAAVAAAIARAKAKKLAAQESDASDANNEASPVAVDDKKAAVAAAIARAKAKKLAAQESDASDANNDTSPAPTDDKKAAVAAAIARAKAKKLAAAQQSEPHTEQPNTEQIVEPTSEQDDKKAKVAAAIARAKAKKLAAAQQSEPHTEQPNTEQVVEPTSEQDDKKAKVAAAIARAKAKKLAAAQQSETHTKQPKMEQAVEPTSEQDDKKAKIAAAIARAKAKKLAAAQQASQTSTHTNEDDSQS
ncbi:electron transport complex protein RnfC [Pseudoalteromonas ulvae UL12]|uniref:electron transport complex subunit RsxC n=1 Tax=Pseudoalteromonas ulvae TaxID=107327 RepID=UPI00186BAFC3|nr:electron transport complex subunit RsxC [Pseudoalteromonas ulvae]MBE0362407.1 electron transport complex protein RnfC [Pseudoalteromonas ulvae UL12]